MKKHCHTYTKLLPVCSAGWHNRLNRKVRRGRLDVYQLAPVLHREAQYVQLQVVLVSEKRLRRHKKRAYAAVQGRLAELWGAYERGEISTTRLLRSCSHVNGPVVKQSD